MSDHDAAGAAREEAAKTATYLVVLAVGIPVLAWIERASSSPDTWRMAKMRAALAAERFCMEAARNWALLADRARAVYEGARA